MPFPVLQVGEALCHQMFCAKACPAHRKGLGKDLIEDFLFVCLFDESDSWCRMPLGKNNNVLKIYPLSEALGL